MANLFRYFSVRTVTVLEILDVAEVVTKNAYVTLLDLWRTQS